LQKLRPTKQSSHHFEITLDHLETAVKDNDLKVFTRLDHAAAAKAVGLEMPPATVLVVGSPQSGRTSAACRLSGL
jgi:uncharacterized protein (DUF302 family)